jgi:hypothetical protein
MEQMVLNGDTDLTKEHSIEKLHDEETEHERQGKKQRKRERNRGRGGTQGCRDLRGGREHTRQTGRWSTAAGEQVRCG